MYLKILKRNNQDRSLFFYFDEIANSNKQRDFFKKYETSLLYDLIPRKTMTKLLKPAPPHNSAHNVWTVAMQLRGRSRVDLTSGTVDREVLLTKL